MGCVCSKLGLDNLDWLGNDKEKEDDYCISCTPKGLRCLGQGPDTSDWVLEKDTSDWLKSKETKDEEEEAPPAEESDWDVDLEQAPNYHA